MDVDVNVNDSEGIKNSVYGYVHVHGHVTGRFTGRFMGTGVPLPRDVDGIVPR